MRFCISLPLCFTKGKITMYCANCGKELPPQCKFCTRCGTQTARPENNSHSQENTLSQGRPYQNQQFPDMPFQNQQFQNSNPQYSNSPFQNGNPGSNGFSQKPNYQNQQFSNPQFQNNNTGNAAFADAAARGASNIAHEAVLPDGQNAPRSFLCSLLAYSRFWLCSMSCS